MRRTRVLLGTLAVALLASAPGQAMPPDVPADLRVASWAETDIRAVVAAGLMGPTAGAFRPDDPLTRGELRQALAALGPPVPASSTAVDPDRLVPLAPAVPAAASADADRLVPLRELDAKLVDALGLTPAARAIRRAAQAAGLRPPGTVGSETVARLLGLRVNHPQSQEQLELAPTQSATRAEAAYSLARARELTPERIALVRELAASFSLPALDEWQRALLDRALRFVGYPYVWAGSSEQRQVLYYGSAPGGFDCSGFVWRVVKLEPLPGAPTLATVLRGRTTFSMSAESPRAERIPGPALQPADLVFFGDRGPRSAPGEIGHMGIYVGNGWFVHSSGNGVTLQPLQGWYAERLAWGRRVLAEAGLAAPPV
jgi:cell wall-associated NlpC family hydrolase